MNSHDTSPVDNNPAAPLDEPVFLSGGKLEDALGYGPVRIQVSGTPFKVDKDNAVIRVRLTVDDSGSLMLCHQESGQVFDCSAVLPPGEWPQLDDETYWQTEASLSVPRGHYAVLGTVANAGTASVRNRTYFRYDVVLLAGETPIAPPVPGEPKKETELCCKCGCCGGEDGDKNVIASTYIPGHSYIDRCHLTAEYMTAPAAARSAAPVLSGGLVYTGTWGWRAAVDTAAATVSVTPPSGEVLTFAIEPGSSTARLSGFSRKYAFCLQLQDAAGNPDTSGSPARLCLVDAEGARVTFDAASGSVLSLRTPEGRLVPTTDFESHVVIRKDGNGFIQSAYCATDGLMRAVPQDDGSILYEWFTPAQVTVQGDSYITTGDPFKTERYQTTVEDGVKTVVITRQQAGLPPHSVTRVEEDGLITITKGSGTEAVVRTIAKAYLGNGEMEYVESLFRTGDASPASCSRELLLYTEGGWLTLERTEGYGSDIARTTSYAYYGESRLVRITRPDGGYTRYEYDSERREVLSAEPWAGGLETLTRTSYADARFFDNRPSRVERVCSCTDGTTPVISATEYVYEDSGALERVTASATAAGDERARTSVTETYGEAAAYPYAAGKPCLDMGADGIQSHHTYEATAAHGAVHKHTLVTMVENSLVAANSRKTEEFISEEDTVVFTQESIWDGDSWLLISTAAHQYDAQQRRTRTTHGNGRFSTKTWMCCGVLSETDEDGVQTDYAYDSAQQLVETTRAAVYDGDTCITPETITEYTRDAAGRVTITTTRAGAMVTTTSTAYDLAGRVVSRTDALGRTTTTSYSADGLVVTTTLPSGAVLVTESHPDGSTAIEFGTGQRSLRHAYDFSGGTRHAVLTDAGAVVSRSTANGFGETVLEEQATTDPAVLLSTAYQYNALGQMVRSQVQESAPMLFTYDEFGNETQRVLALAVEPTSANSPIVSTMYAVTQEADGSVCRHRTTMSYSAAGDVVRETGAELLSEHALLESRSVHTDKRGNVSTAWTEYGTGTTRIAKSTIPGSELTAQAVSVDGFTISSVDHAGITSSASRRFTESGIEYTQTDGRGNTSTTRTDIAGRAISTTDAAGNTTTTAYCPCCDNPATITDALGNTTCYRYDERGRKVAEWGTAIQPALFGYDDADRMTTLTTFRAGMETISTDPAGRTDGDTTTWAYDDATGLETAKTYADGNGTVKSYDAYNRLATETDARGRVKTYSYEQARGLLLGITYSDSTPTESFAYNHLGQLVVVADSAGTRAIGYNEYAEQSTDSLLAGGKTHLVTETRDSLGRSTGYTYAKDGNTEQTVSTAYGTDGRIATAGFLHGGSEKQFSYGYLPGSDLLQTLTMPCNMTLTQSYESQRDLIIGMAYHRGSTLVTQRSYSYDTLDRPLTRNTARNGQTVNDSFVHNSRSELASAMVNGETYGYDYDNIGNRRMAMEASDYTLYEANELNQYSSIHENEDASFVPAFDADGNQTLVKTATGIWTVQYNAENRPLSFTSDDGAIIIECSYDFMGRRATKKVTTNGVVTLHQRYIYRGYLQIACCDLTRSDHPSLWLLTWDPTQPISTRPLAIRKDGTWYAYGWDFTKNITEIFGPAGYIRTSYSYSPFGDVSAEGDVTQPIQWCSEFCDTELGMIYYNYRHYNPHDGRWISRDPIFEDGALALYSYVYNAPASEIDIWGLKKPSSKPKPSPTSKTIMGIEVTGNVSANGNFGKDSLNLTIPMDGEFKGKLTTKQKSATVDSVSGSLTMRKKLRFSTRLLSCDTQTTPKPAELTIQSGSVVTIPKRGSSIAIPMSLSIGDNGGFTFSVSSSIKDVRKAHSPKTAQCSITKKYSTYILDVEVTASISASAEVPIDPSRWSSHEINPQVGAEISTTYGPTKFYVSTSVGSSSHSEIRAGLSWSF